MTNLHSTLVILQSDVHLKINLIQQKSTFHSGYITMYDTKALVELISNLHSTLVILQSLSIMFIRYMFSSTFHSGYITIDSVSSSELVALKSTFHSGYITIRFPRLPVLIFRIYIPLWLYYNLLIYLYRKRFDYLHSTLVILQ